MLNGLVTLPAIYFAEANPNDDDILSLPDGGWKDTDRVQRLVDGIRQSEAIQQSMDEARAAVNRALGALKDSPASLEKDALENLAKYIVDRKV
jgi:geranylgeranyl pyrophosphate synthase